jgi:hypothetical protein
MNYGCEAHPNSSQDVDGAAVSHLAELVRGDCVGDRKGPLVRPFGPPSPQGEKDQPGT